MKIDFIISSLGGGGAERVCVLMANSLANNKNNQVTVITFFGGREDYQLNDSITKVKLRHNKLIPSHTLRSILNLSLYYKTKKNRPDIIVSFVTLTNLISIVVARLFSIKIIAQEHNSHLRYMKNRKFTTNITRKYLYKKADLITVLTSFDLEYYKNYGSNVYIMPNPCSFSTINENKYDREKTILAVGNLNRYHHKGFDNLINLIAPVLRKHADWNLKISGAGDEGLRHLNKLVEMHDLKSQIIFTGFINNISNLMYQSSIFILSSRFEGLPMVLLEAMSQGMACISFDCKTGPSDIIKNDINGLLINDQNLEQMKEGLTKLINDKKLRQKLSLNAIKSIDKYDIKMVTARYESLFNAINN